MKLLALLAVVWLAPAGAALAQTPVYYVDDDGNLYCHDTTTRVNTGPLFFPSPGWGLGDDDVARIVYSCEGVRLSAWSPDTPSSPAFLGNLTFNGSPQSLVALAHDNGVLYGNPDVATEGIYSIDVVTFATTLLYTFSSAAIDIGGLDADPATGLFYGTNDDPSYTDPLNVTGRGIVAFDVVALSEAIVFPYPAGRTDIDGLAFVASVQPSGALYLVEDEPGPIHILHIATSSYDPNPPNSGFTSTADQAGATWGPLTNPGIGTSYCTANPNSTGSAASMLVTGSASVSANNVVLEASDLPLNAFGFFLTSRTQGFVPNPGGSAGNLCIAGAIGRYVGPGQVRNSGLTGSFALAVDLAQHPTPTGPVAVVPGESWNFTAWYRDAVGGVATSNLTDGYNVNFTP
jgi:hypothetical protein